MAARRIDTGVGTACAQLVANSSLQGVAPMTQELKISWLRSNPEYHGRGEVWMFACWRWMLSGLVLVLVTGCASVLNDDRQVVSVRAMCQTRSLPATCVAENSRGRWTFQAPRDIVVPKDMYALRVTCKSVLVDQHTVQVPASMQGAMAGNVLLGGLIGAAIDVGSGRGLSYPASVDVNYPACAVY